MNLEELLRTKVESDGINGKVQISPSFRVAVQSESDAGVHIIIHPDGYNGETLDYMVKGDDLSQIVNGHVLNKECHCSPVVETYGENDLVIHNDTPKSNRPPNPPTCQHGRAIGYGCKECGTGTPVA